MKVFYPHPLLKLAKERTIVRRTVTDSGSAVSSVIREHFEVRAIRRIQSGSSWLVASGVSYTQVWEGHPSCQARVDR